MLSPRETAILIWAAAFSIWALSHASIRGSFLNLLRSLVKPKLLGPIAATAIYVVVALSLLFWIEFWKLELAKDTAVWFFTSCLVLLVHFGTSAEARATPLQTIVVDSAKATIVFEFIVSEYSFPVLVELVLVPTLSIAAACEVFARRDESQRAASALLQAFIGVIGLLMLAWAIYCAAMDREHLATLDTFRRFALGPVLSLSCVPLFFAFALIIDYEEVFLRLRIGAEKDESVLAYARWQIIRKFRWHIERLQEFRRSQVGALMRVRTKSDVDALLRDASKPTG